MGYQNFRAGIPHHKADIFITRKENDCAFLVIQVTRVAFTNQTCFPAILIYIKLHTKYDPKQSDFLIYRINYEASADVAYTV